MSKNSPKFTIITPVYVGDEERKEQLYRAIASVKNQTFKNFEYIIVNDGSPLEFEVPGWVKVISTGNNNRVIATNRGLEKAKGQWICLLDSDDCYESNYLETVNKAILKYPEYKMFNFGCKYVHKDGNITFREAFKPKKKKVGHEAFGGGNIVKGTFVFAKSVYEDLGAFPPDVVENIDCTEINYGGVRNLHMTTPYDFSAWYQLKYPELRKFFMVDHINEPTKIIKELGNPWGDDAALFFQYTRKYHSKPLKDYLYIVYPRI